MAREYLSDMEDIRIVETTEGHVAGFNHCVGVVARERHYIGLTEPPPMDASLQFWRAVLAGNGVHLVAVDANDRVIGWCDIVRFSLAGFDHVGRLGMGLLPDARGKGLGRRLILAAIDSARERGFERVELDVFASNTRAKALYERVGFVEEGVRRRARKLDGQYDDDVIMAMLLG